jgi:hypothetical protein
MDDDDPLINPNWNATIDDNTGDDDDGGTGTSGPGILTINPSAVNVPVTESMTFTAAGGVPPYTFRFADTANATYDVPTDTWTHSINGSTITGSGLFTAGPATGTNTVQVVDQDSTTSEGTVNLITTSASSYKIVSTNLTPYTSTITVPTSTKVYFVVQNGVPPDSFNITNNSGGQPMGFMMGTRMGCWETGTTGADDGSVYDLLQVSDSDNPINVSTLQIYVANTPLAITPKNVVAPSGTQILLDTTGASGVQPLTWTIASDNSGGNIQYSAPGITATYTAGNNTNGVIGAKDIVEVNDSFPTVPQRAQAQANVPGLSAYPRRTVVAPAGLVTLQALGGSGTYTWQNTTPSMGGTLNPNLDQCQYTAGATEGEVIIRLSDNTPGGVVNISIVVCNQVTSYAFTQPGSFHPNQGTIGNGEYYPLDIVVDDFDGNGVPDVALPLTSSSTSPIPYGNFQGNSVSVLMGGAAKGGFQVSAVHYQLMTAGTASPWGITSGDYNGDGNRDLAVACSGFVMVMLGDGTGSFPNNSTYPYINVSLGGGFMGTDIVTYNFDRSNGDDLAVADGAAGQAAILISQGQSNGFNAAITLSCGDPVPTDNYLPACFGIAVANFDNDTTGSTNQTGNGPNGVGYVDIAVTDYYYDRVVIFPGTGLTSWNSSGTPFSVDPGTANPSVMSQNPVGIAAGDIDGNGSVDIVTANNFHYYVSNSTVENGISVLVNSGSGLGFGVAREYGPDRYAYPDYYACYFWHVIAEDFDNDGMDDIAALSRGVRHDPQANYYFRTSQVCVWRGVGGGILNGWGRTGTSNDNLATSYLLGQSSSVYRFFGGAMSAIDFGGHTRNNQGAPLMDIIVAAGCPYNWYAYYGKLALLMNNCD